MRNILIGSVLGSTLTAGAVGAASLFGTVPVLIFGGVMLVVTLAGALCGYSAYRAWIYLIERCKHHLRAELRAELLRRALAQQNKNKANGKGPAWYRQNPALFS